MAHLALHWVKTNRQFACPPGGVLGLGKLSGVLSLCFGVEWFVFMLGSFGYYGLQVALPQGTLT